jgi:beta-lactamase class A
MTRFVRIKRRVLSWFRKNQDLVWRCLMGLGAFALLTVLVQLLYPAGRLLPFVEIQGQKVGGKTVTDTTKVLQSKYNKAKVNLRTEDKTFTKSFEEIGIDVKTWETARAAAHYSFVQRIVPFSSLYIMLTRDTQAQVNFDDERLNYFAEEVHKDGFVAAVNASVKADGSKVQLVPSTPSKDYPAGHVAAALRKAKYAPVTDVHVKPDTRLAERTDDQVKGLLSEAQRAVDTSLTLKLDKEDIHVDRATIGSWLDFPEDSASKKLQLGIKSDVVKKYLEGIQSRVYKAPGVTKVQIIDGREVSRTAGQPGRGIDGDKTVALLSDALKKGDEATVTVPIADLPPTISYDKQYSNGDAGLTALLRDLAGSKGFGISVMEIGGRSGNINGDKKFVAASTYKLFVAYALFKEIEAGRMRWTDPINGNTVQGCFEIMIVRSDNPCAKAFGDKIGWQNIEDQMRGLGLSQTELSPSLYTTAKDLSLFLYKLEYGTLVSAADKSRLTDAMKRQIYRAGIPAGTGLPVADKVGFIDSYIHDAGVVYGPRGPYVLVIMTSGSSWSAIADAAKQINAFLK